MVIGLVAAAVWVFLALLRNGQFRRSLLPAFVFLGGLAFVGLILYAGANHRSEFTGRVLLFAILGAVVCVFVGIMRHWLRTSSAGSQPAAGLPVGLGKNLPAERASSLRKVLLTGGLCLIGLMIVVLFLQLVKHPQPQGEGWLLRFLPLVALTFLFIWGLNRLLRPVALTQRTESCPPVGLLKDFLAEHLSPREHTRLEAHLERCKGCQRWVEGHTAEHKSWAGVARKLSERPPAGAPALQRVIEQLKKEPDPEVTRDEPVFSADLPLGFLSPPEKEGQLGRLERYEVLEEVGRGGMGVVLKAFDPSLHRVVAIKVLAPQLATSGVARQRFLREAKAAAAVSHDNIVTIHAVDEANGLPYLVMQYVAGPSLQQRIDKEGALELAEILRIGMQTAAGLAAAHGHGIVHRDIKPANILLEEGVPRVKLTDFGLARALDDASLTQSGFVAGSPLYMAPEQARGETLDHRADLFSLGSVLYTMCTGRPPFRAANTLAVLRRVCDDAPRPIRETHPEIPDWLAEVVEKLMAKDPADRYQSATEVVEVLGQHLAQLQNRAWVPPPAPERAQAAALPTSVTLCPFCGASLHVPDAMVGTTVHCGECGKAFRAEGTSEEIRVARPVPSPFGRRRPGHTRVLPHVVAVLLFFIVLAALLGFLIVVAYLGVSDSAQTPAKSNPVPDVQVREEGKAEPAPFWKDALGWFPAGATLVGAVDLKAFGSLHLDDEWGKTALRLAFPAKAKELTASILDRIQIDGVSLAYYPDNFPKKSHEFFQLEGKAMGGRRQILDFVRLATSKRLPDEERGVGNVVRVSDPELPFALGLFENQRVFLARSLSPPGKESRHREVLERIPCFDYFSKRLRPARNLLDEHNPAWLKTALSESPDLACGILAGEIPATWRTALTARLQLRTCPPSVVLHVQREDDGVSVSLILNVQEPGEERILAEDLDKWRREGLDVLQTMFPSLREEREALASIGKTLTATQWEADPASRCVRTRVQMSAPTLFAIGRLFARASQAGVGG
jgi:serine/threonine-protein kinase